MPDLPLILAGPIVRRVEPRLAAVWVALSQARSIQLTLFEGREQAGTGPGPFTGGTPRARGAANTLRVGEKLHVGVVYAELPPDRALVPGINYSYNVSFGAPAAGVKPGAKFNPNQFSGTADLKSEGLLSGQPVKGKPNLPLGYTPGELPGFSLPPVLLTELRILHGSCRRPGFRYAPKQGKNAFDGMAWVDDLIDGWRKGTPGAPGQPPTEALNPNSRPHQMFLTGDQIYADDVEAPMLIQLNRAAQELIGKTERIPTRYPPEADAASREKFLGVPKLPGFPDLQAFITKKKSEGKDPLEELKELDQVRVLADPCFDRLYKLLFDHPFQVDSGFTSDPAAPGVRFWPADLKHFPAALRRPVLECESQFSSADLASHLVSLGEYCAMYLAVWCNAIWETQGDAPVLADINQIYQLPSGPLPQLWDFHAFNNPKDQYISRGDRPALQASLDKTAARPNQIQGNQDSRDTLTVFYDSLPRVRRALANVPTYMIFDDHDVTDDWNLTRAWRDQVHTAPLGRSILNASLVAYALFQDWGNDPKRYESGPYRKLLDLAAGFFPENEAAGPPVAVTNELGKLFALNQPNPEPAPALKWHFQVDGPAHRMIALDTRTRRVYRSRHQPSGLLSPEALKEQLPDPAGQPLPAGIEVVVVISQTPALQPSLASSVIMPVMTSITELKNHERFSNLTGYEPDHEIWPGDDEAYQAFLRQLAKFRRVVVLSGEIHFAFSAALSYWKKGTRRLTLAAGLQGDLDAETLSAGVRSAFQGAGITLSPGARVVAREGSAEWLVVDEEARKVFFVRLEESGLNVYEESAPARIAQFVSSGMKNAKDFIATIGRFAGLAFTLLDFAPAERIIWDEKFPVPLAPPEGVRLPPPVRGRLGSAPVVLPTGNWPPGTTVKKHPDFAWRLDLVRDERPDADRPEFTRAAGPLPAFDPNDIPGTYRGIALQHARQLERMRFTRGVLYTVNLGLVRFERDEASGLVACHDLYTHPPERHEPVVANIYRIPLDAATEQRPQLKFDLPVE